MAQYIDKAAVKAIIGRMQDCTMDEDGNFYSSSALAEYNILCDLENRLDTLEVKDPYEQCVQYDSIKAGIQTHAETYSFNIESELFNQLTKEQQKLWRKEIEQAVISGGDAGVKLARDPRYKENLEVKEVDLDIKQRMEECPYRQTGCTMYNGHILECRGACSWVVDYPKLKELKEQKRE